MRIQFCCPDEYPFSKCNKDTQKWKDQNREISHIFKTIKGIIYLPGPIAS